MLNKNLLKIKNIILYIFLLILMCFYVPLNSMADDLGSVKILYHGRTDTGKVILSGAEFSIYYIGSWKDIGIDLSEEFKNSGISMDRSDASDRKKQAELLYSYAVDKNVSGRGCLTDESGCIIFDNLKYGIYLIAQTKKLKIGKNTFYSSPFLISVPIKDNDIYIWDITTEPKSSWTDSDEGGSGEGGWIGEGFESDSYEENLNKDDIRETDESVDAGEIDDFKLPKTGDESGLYLWLISLIISAVVLILIIRRLAKSNKQYEK